LIWFAFRRQFAQPGSLLRVLHLPCTVSQPMMRLLLTACAPTLEVSVFGVFGAAGLFRPALCSALGARQLLGRSDECMPC
jgi:hypothetical protein